jgi:hypothetical protein
MRALARTRDFAVLLLLASCSLRSLEYLEAGEIGGGSGAGAGAGASVGGSSIPGGSGATTNTGGSFSGDDGGTAPVTPDGGEPSTGGTAAQGGTGGVQPSPPDCTDSLVTSDETDKDCGGRTCAPCKTDQRCFTGTDCESAICTNQVCQAPTCTDLAVNGDETDKNCGGSCPPCAQGFRCAADGDCATGKCEQGACVSATCQDDVLVNGCPLLVDNTAYTLSPSHSPTRCIDDANLSVAEGARIVLWSCKPELQQTFWAVDQMDGFFALRSALSGKCLQVRDASTTDGAVVEQSTCDYAPNQLWKPKRVDASLMQLTSKLTGFFLDVAGANVSSDGQLIVQSEAGESGDTRWRVVKRAAPAYVGFSPYADRTIRLRHQGSTVQLSDVDDQATHFKVVPGLQDAAMVSFEARDEPGRYLRHAGFRLWSDKNDGSTQFKKDASFRFANPFTDDDPHAKALESTNFPGKFLLRSDRTALLDNVPDNATAKSNATWWLFHR